MKKVIIGIGGLLFVGGVILVAGRFFSNPQIRQSVGQNQSQTNAETARIVGESSEPPQSRTSPVQSARQTSPNVGVSSRDTQGSCGTTKQLFSMSPVPVDKISTIIPLGNFEPHSHIAPTTQIYVRYLRDGDAPALTTLYAPADMTITQITLFDNNSSSVPFNSYRLDFTLCDGVRGFFILVINPSKKLLSAFHEPYDYVQTSDVGLAKPDHTYRKDVSVAVRAGEVLGTAGGKSIYPDALDFGLSDTRVPAGIVVNPARYEDQDLHYVCPLEYFPLSIANALYAKLGDFDGKRIAINDPKCGEVYQDKPGSAQGVWIAKVSTHPSIFDIPNLLTLGHSSFDHTRGVFSMGNVLQDIGFDNNSLYGFSLQVTGKVNIDFNKVTPDGIVYCYQTVNDRQDQNMTAVVQLLDDHTLRIGKLNATTCGSGPWQFANYLDFVR